MSKSIEEIIKELKLGEDDLREIDCLMHEQSKHLLLSENYKEDYVKEFEYCTQVYLSRKPKGL